MPLKTVILCRTNAPLVKCAFDLIRKGRGVKVKIVGRDIAKSLKDVIGEVLDFRRNAPMGEFNVLLEGWISDIREKYKDDERKEAYVIECEDMYGCIVAISTQCHDVTGLCRVIDEYFCDSDSLDDDPMTVVFASGHRSKGLEWDRVFWIRPDLCPHPAATHEADIRQEEHLAHILPTRAKKELWICHDRRPE